MRLSLNPEQQQAAQAGVNCAVVASAGTGKTRTLTERYRNELNAGRSPLKIVAITYTEKAASELRERIRRMITEDHGRDVEALAELDIAPIGTIHGLCARICREHPQAAGVAPAFSIHDQTDSARFLQEHLDDLLISRGAEAYDPAVLPYDLAREAIVKLLEQPRLAEAALAVVDRPWDEVRPVWEERARAYRAAAWQALCTPGWLQTVEALRNIIAAAPAGHPHAVLEMYRDAIAALETLGEAGAAGDAQAVAEALRFIKGCLNFRRGSAREWPLTSLTMQEAKDVGQAFRAPLTDALEKGDILLEVGEADRRMHEALRELANLYDVVSKQLDERRRQAGVLDFAGLEVGALRALSHEEVRQWYRERWSVLLLDETQDVNPTQSELVKALVGDPRGEPAGGADAPSWSICLVGDQKQSIYGFRGAAVEEFGRLKHEIVGGTEITLDQTYRQHPALADEINALMAPILGELHSAVRSEQEPSKEPGPYVELAIVGDPAPVASPATVDGTAPAKSSGSSEPKVSLEQRRWVEARWVAERMVELNEQGVDYGKMAVLVRSWATLDPIEEALGARGIPSVHAGGGNLMETREALDGIALLTFLADRDNLSLAAVLRSPWFAVDDRQLHALAAMPEGPWWHRLTKTPSLEGPCGVLQKLLQAARHEPAHRLLQLADAATGYTAVLANLPHGPRRLADWRAFEALVMEREADGPHVSQVCRRLKELVDLELEVERPVLEADEAVSLLTIHASKGLEYPIVFVPDLYRAAGSHNPRVRIDRERGIALKPATASGSPDFDPHQATVAAASAMSFQWAALEEAAEEAEYQELKRLLYVACTRAEERLVLSACADTTPPAEGRRADNLLSLLRIGWNAAGREHLTIPYNPDHAQPPRPQPPTPLRRPAGAVTCAAPVGPALDEVPVSSLDIYRRCPREFRYRIVDHNPGMPEGRGSHAQEIGTLVHRAIEQSWTDRETLRQENPDLPDEAIDDAWAMVEAWRHDPAYAAVRSEEDERERAMSLTVGGLTLIGQLDRLGPGYVVDYKTGRDVDWEDHALQVWAYARSQRVDQGYIADLRRRELVPLDAARLAELDTVAESVAAGILQSDFAPDPSPAKCAGCPFVQCEFNPRHATPEAVDDAPED